MNSRCGCGRRYGCDIDDKCTCRNGMHSLMSERKRLSYYRKYRYGAAE